MTDRDVALRGEPTELETTLAREWVRGFRWAVGQPSGGFTQMIEGYPSTMDGSAYRAGYQAGRRALHKAEAEAKLYAREQIEAAGRMVEK